MAMNLKISVPFFIGITLLKKKPPFIEMNKEKTQKMFPCQILKLSINKIRKGKSFDSTVTSLEIWIPFSS